jgi:flagellar hook-associated protein 2
MASTTYISGLASGLDWQSLISQLVAVEQKPITLLQNNKTTLGNQKTAWSDLNTNLLSLKTAAGSLSSLDDFDLFTPTASISGTTKTVGDLMSFAVGSNASEGSYDITVNNLATAQKLRSTTFNSTSDALGISGDVTINNRALSIAATDSLANIRDKINSLNSGENPAGVTASLITVSTGDYRLTLTSKTTGSAGISIDNGSGTDILTTQLGLNQITAGQDAEITLDGVTITRATNQISDVISGVTLNLLGMDENATVTLNVSRDTDGIKKKIQDFVDNYNKVMSYIATQNTAPATGGTAKPLFGDTTLQSIKSTLRSTILSGVSGLDSTLDHLSLIGVNIDKTGQLSINNDTLDGYLKSNFQDVANLFAAQGTSASSNLTYVASGETTAEGDYVVDITRAATRAGTMGSGFSGTLTSDATLTLTGSGGTAQSISLSAGSDMTAIVNAINAGNTLGITAENDGGQLRLSSEAYGSSGNFTLSGISGELGITDNTYTGLDVQGTIRKQGSTEEMTMTGNGQILTVDDGQDAAGLVVNYTGTSDTATLDFTFIKGIGEKLDQALYSMSDSLSGYMANKQTSLQNQMDNIDKKVSDKQASLSRYQDSLTAKFAAMETMLSKLQSQQSWLTSQINALTSSS